MTLSDINAKIVNQRFKELETEILDLKERLSVAENNGANAINLIQAQTEMIQKVWVSKMGTGGTDNG